MPDLLPDTVPHDRDAEWTRELRAEGASAAERLGALDPSDELWRHSDVRTVPLATTTVAGPDDVDPPDLPLIGRLLQNIGIREGLVVTSAHGTEVVDRFTDESVMATELASEKGAGAVGSLVSPEFDLIAALNARSFVGGVHLTVARGARPAAPLVIAHWHAGAATASFPRVFVEVGPLSEVDIVEVWLGAEGTEGSLVAPVTELVVGEGATVSHTVLQVLPDDVTCAGAVRTSVGRDARFTSAVANLGASLGRLRNEIELVGEGAEAHAWGAYVGDGERHVDYRTVQHHVAPRCTSKLLYRGAVWDHASAIQAGLILIEPDAARTNAHQANHYLILSEGARAAAIPNLEIHNHDVTCGHAASGGPPDEEQMYYLEARGIAPDVARRLVVDGFFRDVIGRFPLVGVRTFVGGEVFRRLAVQRQREDAA